MTWLLARAFAAWDSPPKFTAGQQQLESGELPSAERGREVEEIMDYKAWLDKL
jgi:hypothetical protein